MSFVALESFVKFDVDDDDIVMSPGLSQFGLGDYRFITEACVAN